MAKETQNGPSSTQATATAPPEMKPWKGHTVQETFCHPCGGMVNGNGCAKPDCPIANPL